MNTQQETDKINPYHIATDAEREKWGGSEDYDLLIGPDGFECFLGEPEDRSWARDGEKVVAELNRLYGLLLTTGGQKDEGRSQR